jgi:hypothetical protein
MHNYAYLAEDRSGLKGLYDARLHKWLLPMGYNEILYDHNNGDHFYYKATKKNVITWFSISEKNIFSIEQPYPAKPVDRPIAYADTNPPLQTGIYNDPPYVPEGHQSMASYEADGKMGFYGYENRKGIIYVDTVPAVYSSIIFLGFSVEKQLLLVRKNGLSGIVDMHNREIIPIIYDAIKEIPAIKDHDMLLIVRDGKKEGVISPGNELIVPIVYDSIIAIDSSLSNGMYIVQNEKKYGIAKGNRLLLSCEYDNISYSSWNKDFYSVYKEGKAGAYIYSDRLRLYHHFIPPLYDYVWHINLFTPVNFIPGSKLKIKAIEGKYFVLVSENNRKGFIDLNGKEFFKN